MKAAREPEVIKAVHKQLNDPNNVNNKCEINW
jgi:hypothetical protein